MAGVMQELNKMLEIESKLSIVFLLKQMDKQKE